MIESIGNLQRISRLNWLKLKISITKVGNNGKSLKQNPKPPFQLCKN